MSHTKLALLILTVFGAAACSESRNQVGKNNPGGASGIVTGSGGSSGTAGGGGQISSGTVGSGGVAGTPVATETGTGGVQTGGAGAATASKGGTTVAGASGSRVGGSSGSRDGGAGDRPNDTPRDSSVCPEGQIWCPGCTPGTGACSNTCAGYVCPEDAGNPVDVTVGACSTMTTQSACETRRDCHAIFADLQTCGCGTPGCCMRFSRCAEGPADCTKPAQPSCAIPEMLCASPYQVSYRGGCPEGCVSSSACPGVVDGGAESCPASCNSTFPTCCNGACVFTATDPLNCGGCGITCAAGSYCNNGCVPITCTVDSGACGDGQVCCGGACCASGQNCCATAPPVGPIRPGCFTPTAVEARCPGNMTVPSDRDIKRNIVTADVTAVLAKLRALPISTWSYLDEPASAHHLGPMAQDFKRSFGLGNDERSYQAVDAHGVAMAAIQALDRLVTAQNARIEQLDRSNRALARQLRTAERRWTAHRGTWGSAADPEKLQTLQTGDHAETPRR